MLRDLEICYDSDKGKLSIDKSITLYHAAAILRSYINDVVGIPYQPLDPRNISVESSENIVSDEIYNFFYWTICPKLPEDASPVNKGDIGHQAPLFIDTCYPLDKTLSIWESMGRQELQNILE